MNTRASTTRLSESTTVIWRKRLISSRTCCPRGVPCSTSGVEPVRTSSPWQSGFVGVGIEQSASFVGVAKAKAAQLKVGSLVFHQTGISGFQHSEQFDLVICLFNSLAHLQYEEIVPTFKFAIHSLKPGGCFVIETVNFLNIIEKFRPVQIVDHKEDSVIITRWIRNTVDHDAGMWVHDETMLVNNSGNLQTYYDHHSYLIFKADELEFLLRSSGFSQIKRFRSFRHTDEGTRLIYVARP